MKNKKSKSKITFYGGTGSVTGANFLLEIKEKDKLIKILVDCGIMQGSYDADDFNREDFPYKPEEIDFLLVTHSHMDHIGRIPKLVKKGFMGRIISTPPSRDISEVLFGDAIKVMDAEAKKSGALPMYDSKDVDKAMSLWETLEYHKILNLTDEISIYMKDSGHILGSSMIEVNDGENKILFTGDLGNSPSLLLNDTEEIDSADYIVTESVYGDRNHEPKDERRNKLRNIIKEVTENKQLLIIPAFSLERTQMLLYEMNNFFENKELESIPVFLDSPLAIKITKIYKKYSGYLKESVRDEIQDDDVFSFPKLKSTALSRESEKISLTQNPKIIIAGSGMSSGGRIIQHEKEHVGDRNAVILLVGYQSVGTLGRQLEDGAKKVKIYNEEIHVRAKIVKINGYSSHKDSDNLVNFIEIANNNKKLKKVFTVMGEPKSSLFLVQRLRDELGVDAEYPEYGKTIEL
jgi:metallo-beta-lactamase family protein